MLPTPLLVTIDVVTFRTAFVGFSIEFVFLRTHLISFRVCVGRPGSKLEQCLCKIENLAPPNHFLTNDVSGVANSIIGGGGTYSYIHVLHS